MRDFRLDVARRMAKDLNVSLRGIQQAEQELDRRGLTGAVRAEQAENSPRRTSKSTLSPRAPWAGSRILDTFVSPRTKRRPPRIFDFRFAIVDLVQVRSWLI